MALGTYANGGIDSNGNNDVVDSVLSGGPISITKIAESPVGDTDPNVLSLGDGFTISGSTDQFAYVGTDGSGGILAANLTDSSSLWLSDSTIAVGATWPALTQGDTTICFAAGTLIATPDGERVVESLRTGDLVLAAEARAVPVRWIGRQTIVPFLVPEHRRPVRIAAGALAEGMPARDLRVTSDHALLLDGVLVNAGALVNGTTIRHMTPAELGTRFTVFHIETAAQEIILAEGTPAETFVDNVSRRRFDNHADYVALHGPDAAPIPERPEPRAMSRRQVPPATLARIAVRASALAGMDHAAA